VAEVRVQPGGEDHEAQVDHGGGGEHHPDRRAGGDQRQCRQLRAAGEHRQRHAGRLPLRQPALGKQHKKGEQN
jgi:hypothetical protein